MENKQTSQAGKGDRPRNCFSQDYRNNYDLIDWSKNKKNENNNDDMPSVNVMRTHE